MARWSVADIPNQEGRVIIITGANSGLGLDSTRVLAGKGAQIVMAVRNTRKGEDAKNQVLQTVPNAKLDLMALDLSSLDSVKAFAEAFRAKYDRLDILMNNAGLMAIPRQETADGFEMQLGVNHLAPFALTGHLLEMLLATPNSRVVSVSSFTSVIGKMHFDDLQGEQSYSRYGAYVQSKLANILFAFELQRRLSRANAGTISVVVHPGYANTELQSNSTNASGVGFEKAIYRIANRLLAQTSLEGAYDQLYAATMPDVNGCDFIGPRWLTRGLPTKVKATKRGRSEADAKRLWEVSETLTDVHYEALSGQRVTA